MRTTFSSVRSMNVRCTPRLTFSIGLTRRVWIAISSAILSNATLHAWKILDALATYHSPTVCSVCINQPPRAQTSVGRNDHTPIDQMLSVDAAPKSGGRKTSLGMVFPSSLDTCTRNKSWARQILAHIWFHQLNELKREAILERHLQPVHPQTTAVSVHGQTRFLSDLWGWRTSVLLPHGSARSLRPSARRSRTPSGALVLREQPALPSSCDLRTSRQPCSPRAASPSVRKETSR